MPVDCESPHPGWWDQGWFLALWELWGLSRWWCMEFFPWPWRLPSQACTHHNLAENSRSPRQRLQSCRWNSVLSALLPGFLWPLDFLSPQLYFLNWGEYQAPPGNLLGYYLEIHSGQQAEAILGVTSFVCQLLGIPVLHCLMLMSRKPLSYIFCPSFLGLFQMRK